MNEETVEEETNIETSNTNEGESKPAMEKEQAKDEIDSWLDHKQVSPKKRLDSEDNIETLIDSMCEGFLSLDPSSFVLTLKLKSEIRSKEGNNIVLEELNFKSRLQMVNVRLRTKNVKATDGFAMINAYICALTGKNSGIIDLLDTEDNRIAQAIGHFFL